MPEKGDAYEGVDQQDRLSKKYTFATAVPVEQLPGFVDLYYLAPFEEQEKYNFVIEYPYVDRTFPRFTRTYVVPRTDDLVTQEPNADDIDPGLGRPFQLTDHKIERFTDDAVLDAIFVKVMRVFEKLPGPVITSFEQNNYQQDVTVKAQEVQKSPPPVQSALTESVKQERTGTAKAKNTLATVPRVFPKAGKVTEIPSMTRELWLGGFVEQTDSQQLAGQVDQDPMLAEGLFNLTENQTTEFKKELTLHTLPLPQVRAHQELTEEFGGGMLTETLNLDRSDSALAAEEGYLITESRLRNLPGVAKVKMQKALSDASEWPELREDKTITEGVYSGVVVETLKKIVPAAEQLPVGYNPFGTGVWIDYLVHDKWRSMRLKSHILSYPTAPLVYFSTEEVHLPAQINAIDVVWELTNELNSHTELSLDNTSGFAYAKSNLTQVPHLKPIITEGYRGYAKARVTRTFVLADFNGGLASGEVPSVFKITPVYGTAIVTGKKIGGTIIHGNTQDEVSSEGGILPAIQNFGPFLSVNYDQEFAAPFSSSQPVSAGPVAVTAGPKPGTFSAFTLSFGPRPTARVVIPPSTPTALTSGQSFVWRVTVTRGLLNLYAIEVIEIFVP